MVRNRVVRRLEVVPPGLEGFEDGEECLVVCIVVEFCAIERAAVESDRVDIAVIGAREDSGIA